MIPDSWESVLIRVDYLVLSKLVFDWADSYDAKVGTRISNTTSSSIIMFQDWDRLRSIIAPTLTVCSPRISHEANFYIGQELRTN